jgi:hypothetical protein
MNNSKLLIINNHHSPDGEIRYPRQQAQANLTIKKRIIKDKNGREVQRRVTTPNDEKIADTCTQIFQESNLAKEFDYTALREMALTQLEERFNKYNMIISAATNDAERLDIEKRREIAIAQHIRNHIENNINLKFEFDYDSFIEMTGIKSAKRVGEALRILYEAQGKASYEYKLPEISEDFKEISYELAKVSTVPKIGLVLDEEMGAKYENIMDYAQSNVSNKKKHINGIRFELSKAYLTSVLGLGRDFTELTRKDRNAFKSSYSFRLDTLVRSIEKVQHIKKFNYYTIDDIQKKFGTNFKEYADFKARVLNPAIKDLNEFTDLIVELVEIKSSRQVVAVSFKIARKFSIDGQTKFGVNKTAYYIASRLYYFSNQKINNLIGFARHIEKELKIPSLIPMYADKEVQEWEDEADLAVKTELEVIKIIDANISFFKNRGLYYDEKRMCLIEKVMQSDESSESKEPKEVIKIIKKADYKITDPMTSLRYIRELIENEEITEFSIIDFIPFKVACLEKGWLNIDTIHEYLVNKQTIIKAVLNKNSDYFRFDNPIIKESFVNHMARETFKELHDEYRQSIVNLTKNS